MTGSNDVAIVGGCGHVGLPLGLALRRRGLDVALYDVDPRGRRRGERRARCRSSSPARPRCSTAVARVGPARASPPIPRSIARSRARRRRRRHPGRRAPEPRPERGAARRSRASLDHLRDGQLLVLRSTVYPGVTAMVEQLLERLGPRRRRRLLPRAHRRGQGASRSCYELPQIVVARAPTARARAGREALRQRSPTRSSASSSRRPSSRSCSPTPGATSSSRPPTSSS